MKWPTKSIGRIAPPAAATKDVLADDNVWHLTLDQIESGTGRIINKRIAPASQAGSSSYTFDSGNVLYSKLRPYLNKVVCPEEIGIATTELIPLRPIPDVLDRKFLTYYLRSPQYLAFASIAVAGVKMPRIIMAKFWRHEVPLPPLSEQRRIVEILDQADALRKKRVEADAKAARILPALFHKMFGDPATNPKGWDRKPFDGAFEDCTARCPKLQKNEYLPSGRFPVIDQGKELVAGYSDDESLVVRTDKALIVFGDHTRVVKHVDFPFVAGADGSRVFKAQDGCEPAFLSAQLELLPIPNLGYSRHMREIRRFQFITPPPELQEEFANHAATLRLILRSHLNSCNQIDSLWNVLLHRAFTGDLTAKWREAHMKELLAEMEVQAKALESQEDETGDAGERPRRRRGRKE